MAAIFGLSECMISFEPLQMNSLNVFFLCRSTKLNETDHHIEQFWMSNMVTSGHFVLFKYGIF